MERTRIIGVDVAKIIGMFLVVAAHVGGFGLTEPSAVSPGFDWLRRFLGTLITANVDIFAIASGFVCAGIRVSNREQLLRHARRIVKLWLQVLVTGIVILAVIRLCGGEVNLKSWGFACFPIAKDQYWYMTAYMMLLFVMPIVNGGLAALSRSMAVGLVGLLLAVVCVETFFASGGALGVESGYSFNWILILYLVGATWRMHLYGQKDVRWGWMLIGLILVSVFLPMLFKVLSLPSVVLRALGHLQFVGYTSPFTVGIAICIFGMCLSWGKKIGQENRCTKVILLLSSTSLGVYLIHMQPVLAGYIFRLIKLHPAKNGLDWFGLFIGWTLAIYLACSALDWMRLWVFSRIGRLFGRFRFGQTSTHEHRRCGIILNDEKQI